MITNKKTRAILPLAAVAMAGEVVLITARAPAQDATTAGGEAAETASTTFETDATDAAVDKATYPASLGLERSRREARRLTRKALAALDPLRRQAARLRQIADYLLERDY